jgi:hypothetical protein
MVCRRWRAPWQHLTAGTLAQHGIYPTYFREVAFTFNSSNTSAEYNTADNLGGIHAGSGLLYAGFSIDRSLLASPYQLHFDLYNESLITRRGVTDIDVNRFAPFSHDAGTTTRNVPEPSSLLLMGAGLAGIGILRRKFANSWSSRLYRGPFVGGQPSLTGGLAFVF